MEKFSKKWERKNRGFLLVSVLNMMVCMYLLKGFFLEIIKENGLHAKPGEMGRIIITDLFNMAMPLIRYELGDMAIAGDNEECTCGCKLPKITKILGRNKRHSNRLQRKSKTWISFYRNNFTYELGCSIPDNTA